MCTRNSDGSPCARSPDPAAALPAPRPLRRLKRPRGASSPAPRAGGRSSGDTCLQRTCTPDLGAAGDPRRFQKRVGCQERLASEPKTRTFPSGPLTCRTGLVGWEDHELSALRPRSGAVKLCFCSSKRGRAGNAGRSLTVPSADLTSDLTLQWARPMEEAEIPFNDWKKREPKKGSQEGDLVKPLEDESR
ncbi:hypothetical protein MJT46_003553 [Ovis ammon polii x Ovis aries]|nr:hypothetical protein MJT46_003553 [Ovis ammon polii x Ovis aries]